MKWIVLLFVIVACALTYVDEYRKWSELRKIVKKGDIRKAVIVQLARTGSSYCPKIGDRRTYTWIVEIDEGEEMVRVPTLHKWYIHPRDNSNFHKEKFNRKEKGKEVEVYYSKAMKRAVIKEKLVGLYMSICFEVLIGLLSAGVITYVFFFL